MNIEFKRLTEVDKNEIIELMNNKLVRRHMPLLKGEFNESVYNKFIKSKELLWLEYGYGPWAFIYNDKFVGWGGLQPEHGDVDLALVLHPDYWGLGHVLYQQMMNIAFGDMGLKSITILIPPTRSQIKGLIHLGFKKEAEVLVKNEHFFKYRLEKKYYAPDSNNNH